ncbi:response regulator [Desulfopila aestuarii]|uniref:Response regulator receiver domain-containing protein n=1 Tax=Desulfopila aestuarii DSM 18488 TaxID=1121416 RepID=A0A1M7YG51_9BACT|nr:response regulator [Desulfopila aestuarii]SHO51612.1 Response regulator receiver domain-containing protein [Desulfopila aestuarii DSM 18488]
MKNIHILFVDDEQSALNSLYRILRKSPYSVHFANSGQDALKIMEMQPVHVLVTDMKMPEMDGLALLRHVKKNYPETVRLVLSAYTMTAQLLPCINSGEIFRFITKPMDRDEVNAKLNESVDYYLLQQERRNRLIELQSENQELALALERKRIIEQIQSDAVEELEQELTRRTQLTGFISLCSGCKKVRTEKNQWQEIEKYLHRKIPQVDFSHGICPDCFRRLYPDFLDTLAQDKG